MSEVLLTARLRLEPLAPRHREALAALYADPAVARLLLSPVADEGAFETLFRRALACGATHGMWAVWTRQPVAFAGRVGFFAFSDRARPELAFLLAPPFWGRGLATEACRAALAQAFTRHGWEECVALARADNTAALRVCEKLGMRHEASLQHAGGEVRLQRVSRTEFHEAHPGPAARVPWRLSAPGRSALRA